MTFSSLTGGEAEAAVSNCLKTGGGEASGRTSVSRDDEAGRSPSVTAGAMSTIDLVPEIVAGTLSDEVAGFVHSTVELVLFVSP